MEQTNTAKGGNHERLSQGQPQALKRENMMDGLTARLKSRALTVFVPNPEFLHFQISTETFSNGDALLIRSSPDFHSAGRIVIDVRDRCS
jgi:hypothetical protein